MPLQYQPKKESEIKRFATLPAGEYPFTVLACQEQESKSVKNKGRLMCAVKLNVHGPESDKHVYDYFADWFSEWKLKHFMETTGNAQAYLSGNVDATEDKWAGFEGFVLLGVETDPKYGEKNVVEDYVPRKGQTVEDLDFSNPTAASKAKKPAAVKPKVQTSSTEPDDDIPF